MDFRKAHSNVATQFSPCSNRVSGVELLRKRGHERRLGGSVRHNDLVGGNRAAVDVQVAR